MACVASATAGTRYPNPFSLGGHSYQNPGLWERNGIVYACRAGFVDITHLRKFADWTAFLAYRLRETILARRTDFSFRMLEPSVYHLRIEYPEGWDRLSARARDETAVAVSIELGSYFAFTVGTWHEMLTWFGYKGAGFFPEYPSAFSWEDCYSNALGCRIATTALRDPNQEYNEAVTLLLNRELTRLGVQPRPAAWKAGKAVYRQWFTGNYFWYHIVKRNFDIGLDDDSITPWLVPGMSGCNEPRPEDCPVPTLAFLERRGFALTFDIEPREWEGAKIMAIVYPNGSQKRIEPVRHFGLILKYIRAQAVQRYGPHVGDPGGPGTQPTSRQALDLSALAARWLRERPF